MKLMLLQLLLLLDGSQLRQPATQPAARRRSFSQPADVEQPTGPPQAAGRGAQPADPHQSHSAGLWLLPRATGEPPPPMHPSLPPTSALTAACSSHACCGGLGLGMPGHWR
jgi:hypothetical protein